MKVELIRIYTSPTYTIGKLYIDGVYQNDTLEDPDRGLDQSMSAAEIRKLKVYRRTAIPTGTYKITMSVQSPKFSKYPFYLALCKGYLPRLVGVKCYDGVLMHCGSTADNTDGCLLQGYNTIKGRLTNSQAAFTKLMKRHFLPAKMLDEDMEITISRKYKVQ